MKVNTDSPNAPVESHYYLLLGENGYPGLISWLLLISMGLFRNLQGFLHFRHSFERCLCLGIMAGCSLNYVQSTLERVLTQPRNLMLWLFLFAITARLELMRREHRARVKAGVLLTDSPDAPLPPTGPATPPPRPPAGLPWPGPHAPQPTPPSPAPSPAYPVPDWAAAAS